MIRPSGRGNHEWYVSTSAAPKGRVAKRPKKWRSLKMSARHATSGCVAMSSYHQVVPDFWAPMPTKSGGPATSPSPSAGAEKSNPSSHGA